MAFSNGQLVSAADLNNFSVTSVTTSGDVTVGDALDVTGAATLGSTLAVTGTINSQTISATASFTGSVAAAGLLDLSGAAAGQIKFPAAQNASTNANTLDDYEEGTWTPVIGGDGGQSGQTYAVQVGRYVKIGRMVIAQFRVQLSVLGTVTGSAQIQGLPFTSENTTNQSSSAAVGRWISLTTAAVAVQISNNPNTTTAYLWFAAAAAASLGVVVQGDLSAATYLEGTICYSATA